MGLSDFQLIKYKNVRNPKKVSTDLRKKNKVGGTLGDFKTYYHATERQCGACAQTKSTGTELRLQKEIFPFAGKIFNCRKITFLNKWTWKK